MSRKVEQLVGCITMYQKIDMFVLEREKEFKNNMIFNVDLKIFFKNL